MAENNSNVQFTETMEKALAEALHAQCMLDPLLRIIGDECQFSVDDVDSALESQGRLLSLADSARRYSTDLQRALEQLEVAGWSLRAVTSVS